MSVGWIIAICVVSVVALAIWLFAVIRAERAPHFKHANIEPRRGRVQGGTHVGGGRSVAPRRDGEISPGDDPEEPTVPVRKRRGSSPLDL